MMALYKIFLTQNELIHKQTIAQIYHKKQKFYFIKTSPLLYKEDVTHFKYESYNGQDFFINPYRSLGGAAPP